jgi:hypothetical protein
MARLRDGRRFSEHASCTKKNAVQRELNGIGPWRPVVYQSDP